MPDITLEAGANSAILRLEKALDHPEKLLERWGALGVSTSQRAFREQKLGDLDWEPRYPNQRAPKFNVAGAWSDFNSGLARPKPNRFEDRPALIDEGARGGLLASLTWKVVSKDTVEWGSNKPYAKLHQEGGRTRIDITGSAVNLAKEWLFTKKGKVRKGKEVYAQRLAHGMRTRIHAQRIIARPFVGIPDQLRDEMIKAAVRF